MEKRDALRYRIAPLEMTPSEFRRLGYQVIEHIAEFLCTLPDRPVTPNESPGVTREALGTGSLPEHGTEANYCSRRPPGSCSSIPPSMDIRASWQ
jgi:hypothetical protein